MYKRRVPKRVDEENKLVPKRRKVNRMFSFNIDGQKERVCKKFFLSTLSVGESYVDHALRNSQHGSFTGSDKRGKHRPHNTTPEIAAERAKQHIMSFPVVKSHYTHNLKTHTGSIKHQT